MTTTTPALAETDTLLEARLEAHITFLADDLLRGRQPGTAGYDIAAAYVASQFRQMGLQAAGDEGGYLQNVPLRSARLDEGSARMSLERNGEVRDFRFVDEFYTGPNKAHRQSALNAGMVFAGYGIHAPALDYSDYEGLDVEGKVVVIFRGMPLDFPSEEGAHFSSGREITYNAIERGAIGLVSVYTPRAENRFAWKRLESMVGTPSMGWLDGEGEVFPDTSPLQGNVMVHYSAADVLFQESEYSLEDLLERDEAGEALPGFELQGTLSLGQSSSHENISSKNVVAYLPGSDPLLNGEFVVYTAHLDHIGELHGNDHDDAINNGALDNASGISVMLETARLFSAKEPPRRSVLFLAVTAEEKGLVGSGYFAHHPTVPVERMAGLVNLDMPLLLYDFGDVIAFGAEHSTMGDVVESAAGEFGVKLTPDPFPEQNIFVRSDHYRFVQQGVPSVFLVTGTTMMDGTADAQAIFEAFLKDHYHTPSDDLDLPINYGAAARFTRINTRIGEIIGNQPERPMWREGDFFGETFSR
ncbi:MAG: M28 family metallopeptidase [Xanthomonadales bacterium]|nr:M28 family metallopeptidase [Xanthomonadales bacterium]